MCLDIFTLPKRNYQLLLDEDKHRWVHKKELHHLHFFPGHCWRDDVVRWVKRNPKIMFIYGLGCYFISVLYFILNMSQL